MPRRAGTPSGPAVKSDLLSKASRRVSTGAALASSGIDYIHHQAMQPEEVVVADALAALRSALQQLEQERATLELQIEALRSVLGPPVARPIQPAPRVADFRQHTRKSSPILGG